MIVKKNYFLWVLSLALLFVFSGCGGPQDKFDGGQDGSDGGIDDCQRDNSQKGNITDEWKLTAGGEARSGYICPRQDIDHFWFEVSDPRTIVRVSLANNVALSPVDLCYDIFLQGSDIRRGGLCDSDGMDGITELTGTHYLDEAGTYFLEVRDEGGDDEDPRLLDNYMLSIELVPDKDSYESNNTADEAKQLGAAQGYISYLGDHDWFKLTTSSAGQILVLDLSNNAQTPVDLRYEVFMPDKTTPINAGQDDDGMRETTSLHDVLGLPEAGTYYVLITDVGDDDSDTETGYTLALSTQSNPDPRDQSGDNNNWEDATSVSSGQTIADGYLATRGDVDWYVISSPGTSDSNPALIEIDLQVPSGSPLIPAVDLVVADPNTPCSAGDDCGYLVWTCSGCEMVDQCLDAQCPSHECDKAQGKCTGAGECIDGGSGMGCGIRSLVMHGPDFGVSGNAKHLHTVAPMYGSRYYLMVRDYQARHIDIQNSYSFTATVHPEQDTHESPPNGLYLPYITDRQEDDTRDWNKSMASTINCSDNGSEISCGPIEGYISFRGDQDWYKLVLSGQNYTVPKEAESDPVTMGESVDFNVMWDWSFSGSGMNLGYVVMRGSDEMGPELGSGSGSWGDAGGQCSYLCGEYHLPTTLYLWVFTPDFKKYDFQHPYNLTIRAVRGVCPDNCGYCLSCPYMCPNTRNPDPQCI
ncbi:MAG TPA: hypothetical protein VM425_11395 [Myxococcota bacterium]|nr:hypothetical protein [Myxococcota bacterium]